MHIEHARAAVERGMALTSQLLAFAKRQELDLTTAEVNELLRDMEPMLRQAAGSGVTVKLELGGSLPECRLDRAQFEAALLNLVINARDAMPNGGVAEVSTGLQTQDGSSGVQSAQYVAVRIRDTGPGIPPENLKRVFEPFFTTKGERGTGLGLAQIYAFMQQVGGDARITSTVGVGTTVELLFLAASRVDVVSPAEASPALLEGNNRSPHTA